ncbi:centromere/kinetochore protein zw10 homolog [Anthonomus grandis grandis]|uniref:centromere/kinetochore protein zw10 homolog n=1 Tax=Anthonomus grandis grandis TaxID=2921223 RepID=UPI0021651F1C|nr:centromere/kinetochore protein zw10 homolog [Anthonomus grandis grandis]
MSIVAHIVESATKVDIQDINKKVPELKCNVEAIKQEVVTDIINIFVKYKQTLGDNQRNSTLFKKATEYQQTLQALSEKASFIISKDLVSAEKEVHNNIKELQILDFKINVVMNIIKILKCLADFKTKLAYKQYEECVAIMKDLKLMLESIPKDEHLDVFDDFHQSIMQSKLKLDTALKNIFTTNISLKVAPEKKRAILTVKKHNEEMQAACLAYFKDTEHIDCLNRLAKDLWVHIFTPIVDQEINITEQKDSLIVSIRNPDQSSDYKTVFGNLQKVLQFLGKNINYKLSEQVTVLEYIGNDIRDNLSELIVKNCLRNTIPSTVTELENYKVVIEDTKHLEKSLLEAKIFNENTTSILEYANNVDIHFINKKCEEYLQKATDLMKKDLHDVVEIGVPYNPEYPLGKEKLEFPHCSISKNVRELLDLCEEILQKALSASPTCSGHFFVTVTNILLTYRNFVPEFHKTYLAALPQQIAIFFNNCQYISHILVQWNLTYCSQLKPVLGVCEFSSEAEKFPVAGLTIFENYIATQVKMVEEIMQGAQLDGTTIEKLDVQTEKCIRQCLRQQELLRTVWHKVLPYEAYNKNVGIIVNALCKSVISNIVKFEDIPAKVAEDLVDVIKLILTRAPKLFTNPSEITLFVSLWYKINELSFVLNASLADINDRWADGKGLLALHFEGAELKQLIKALFQNTDRRAKVLAKISSFAPYHN